MLLAEDLLLLLTDDDTGKSAASGAPCRRGGLRRAFARGPAGGQGSRSHGRQPAGRGCEHRGQKQGKKSRSVVARLGKRARVRLYERLVEGPPRSTISDSCRSGTCPLANQSRRDGGSASRPEPGVEAVDDRVPKPLGRGGRHRRGRRPHPRAGAAGRGAAEAACDAELVAGHPRRGEVTNLAMDAPAYAPMVTVAKQTLTAAGEQRRVCRVVADTGYWSVDNLAMKGVEPFLTSGRARQPK